MLTDDVLFRIFAHKEMHTIPVGCQSTAVNVFQDILAEIVKEDRDATIQSLLEPTVDEQL
jgi:hypothetical protein